MSHTPAMADSEGVFNDRKPVTNGWACPHCKAIGGITYRKWESSCGGWEDLNYHCTNCGTSWWVEGIDS
jgi:hypothetical protein